MLGWGWEEHCSVLIKDFTHKCSILTIYLVRFSFVWSSAHSFAYGMDVCLYLTSRWHQLKHPTVTNQVRRRHSYNPTSATDQSWSLTICCFLVALLHPQLTRVQQQQKYNYKYKQGNLHSGVHRAVCLLCGRLCRDPLSPPQMHFAHSTFWTVQISLATTLTTKYAS